jgi:hypothetical protein
LARRQANPLIPLYHLHGNAKGIME